MSGTCRYAEQFVAAGAKMVSVHIEADANVHRTLASIKAAGALAGVVLNPATPVGSLDEALAFADYVLVMIADRKLPTRIEIDGGIDSDNIAAVVDAGAEIIVSGSAIFGTADPEAAVRELREATVQWD